VRRKRDTSDPGAPVGEAEFAALMHTFAPFEARPVVALAVSGGRDSRALALLAHRWATRRRGRAVALVVDHGLRPEAAAEAAQTAAWLRSHGIASRILRWRPESPPRAGIQAAARRARYRLLLDWCRRHGVLHLLTAHQANDNVETHLLRAAHDSGAAGLAGMSALVEHPEARLLRPLLSVSRARLTATLAARHESWIDDPSNTDPRFARARLRRDSPSPPAGATSARLARLGRARIADDLAAASAIARCCTPHPLGAVQIDPAGWRGLPPSQAQEVLASAVATVSGADYKPRRARARRAAQRMRQEAALPGSVPSGMTLGGCRILWRGGGWLIAREPAAMSGQKESCALPGIRDGRFRTSRVDDLPGSATALDAWRRAWPATAGLPALLPALPLPHVSVPPGAVEGALAAGGCAGNQPRRGPALCFRPGRPLAAGPFFPCFAPAKGQIVNRRTRAAGGGAPSRQAPNGRAP
jgi:tRNA(Ile)-lysidine synthase